MPDAPQETPPEPVTPSSPTPPSGTPGASPEYRYPNDQSLPEWARGKTAMEVLQLTQGLVESVGRGTPAPTPPPAPAPAQLGDEDYVTGKDMRAMRQSATAEFSPLLAQMAEQNALLTYSTVKRDHADIFKKYEPEIAGVLGRIPKTSWTLDTIENAVKFVKGNHVAELVDEQIRLRAASEPTIRSSGSGGLAPVSRKEQTLESEAIPDRWKDHAKQVGITEREVQEFCWANDMSPEDFFKQFKTGLVTDAVVETNFKRTA